jgi:uncharacterized protein (DUF924 family)
MSPSPLLLNVQPRDVLDFWREAGPSRWFKKDEGFDRQFAGRFMAAHEAAARGDLDQWANDADGSLALLILLDQFPRNVFRGTPRMFATDAKARDLSHGAIAAGFDAAFEPPLRNFFYMPLMHSERLEDLDLCVKLLSAMGGNAARYAQHHRKIVERFGRFPHRNAILGRTTPPDEQRFLDEGGFAG